MDFHHLSDQDSNCTNSNDNVFFNIYQGQPMRPDAGAEAFLPGNSRAWRQVVVRSDSSGSQDSDWIIGLMLQLNWGTPWGFRHESTRQEASSFFRSSCLEYDYLLWRPIAANLTRTRS